MAPELFKGQDFRLTLNSGIDLTGNTLLQILFKTPTGKVGAWTTTQILNSAFHDVTSTENNEGGEWRYQLYTEISGKKYFGEIVKKIVLETIVL